MMIRGINVDHSGFTNKVVEDADPSRLTYCFVDENGVATNLIINAGEPDFVKLKAWADKPVNQNLKKNFGIAYGPHKETADGPGNSDR